MIFDAYRKAQESNICYRIIPWELLTVYRRNFGRFRSCQYLLYGKYFEYISKIAIFIKNIANFLLFYTITCVFLCALITIIGIKYIPNFETTNTVTISSGIWLLITLTFRRLILNKYNNF